MFVEVFQLLLFVTHLSQCLLVCHDLNVQASVDWKVKLTLLEVEDLAAGKFEFTHDVGKRQVRHVTAIQTVGNLD